MSRIPNPDQAPGSGDRLPPITSPAPMLPIPVVPLPQPAPPPQTHPNVRVHPNTWEGWPGGGGPGSTDGF
jgi:hypothetical protein